MMISQDKFADIRPYNPDEVPAAVARMTANPQFGIAVDYLFDKQEAQQIYADLAKVKTGFEFQKAFMYKAINRVLKLSSDGLSLGNVAVLKHNGPSVLLSNHRDILLDSAMLQVVLVDQGMETSEITFGSNLMFNDFIVDFGKVNRMYTVFREGNLREMLAYSKHLSEYIFNNTQNKKVSSWIAQRKGRTKDGMDKTEPAVLKMLTMFNRKDPIQAFLSLNILPVTVSYEWEPCDFSKVRESYISQKKAYIKQPGEDFTSVLNGITLPKGRVKISFGKPVNQFINEELTNLDKKNIHHKVAEFIDQQIYMNYQLTANNYFAYDSLMETEKYSDRYNSRTEELMNQRIVALYEFMGARSDEIKKLFLSLYAGPVMQRNKVIESMNEKIRIL